MPAYFARPRARRHDPGAEPGPRRAPLHGHPVNFSGRFFKTVFYGVRARHRDHRLRRGWRAVAARARARSSSSPAPAPTRASSTSRASPRSPTRSGALLMVDMAHIAGLVAAGLHPSPVPHARDRHHAPRTRRCAARAAGSSSAARPYAKAIDKAVFPGIQGGPLMHVIAAKAVAFHEALQPEFKALPGADRRQRPGPRRRAGRARLPARLRRHRQPPDARRPRPARHHRQGRRDLARRGGHHRQQEHDPLRPAAAGGDQRHPARHAGPDHPRHGRGGDARRSRG